MFRTNVYNHTRTVVQVVLNPAGHSKSEDSWQKKVSMMNENRRHHYRIVNPVRFFIFVVLSIMIVIFAGYSIMGISNADAAAVRTYKQVVIQDGDNLWNLIESYNPGAHIDVRNAIYDVYEINDISESDVRPGETIFIPVY